MMGKKQFLAGIDVGTTKICTTCAQSENGTTEILGTGWAPSRGLKKGVVVNLSETIESVKVSLEEAERNSQTSIESAYVSIGGVYIRGINSAGETEVRSKNGEITDEDVSRAVTAATSGDLGDDYQIIHVLTRDFNVDGHAGVVNPLGMNGKHLSVALHLVLNASAVVQNIVNAINKAGVLVSGVVMQQLASAEAVLSADEKELGTVGKLLLIIAVLNFSLTTMFGYSYYGRKCAGYIFGTKWKSIYNWFYVSMIVIASIVSIDIAINFVDGMFAMMCLLSSGLSAHGIVGLGQRDFVDLLHERLDRCDALFRRRSRGDSEFLVHRC